jgi:hypothetical protein
MGGILRAASRKQGEPLNILAMPIHERVQSNLCKTGHQFWALRLPNLKDWNTSFAKVPDNFVLLDRSKSPLEQLPANVEFDLVMSEHKFGAYQVLHQIANRLQVPLLSIEHTLPHPGWAPHVVQDCKRMTAHLNVFISDFSRDAWGYSPQEAVVVHHGVNTDLFSPATISKQNYVLSVVNDASSPERAWCIGFEFWKEMIAGLPWNHLGTSKDGFSKPADGVADLVKHYRECAVFVDTAQASPIPTVLLEAMSSGAICVSRGNAMVPEVITDGYNGFIRSEPQAMRELVQDILANPSRYDYVKHNARQTILERFSLPRYVADWNRIFASVVEKPWMGPVGAL